MEKILIITDSCSDLEIKENDSKPLRILPLTINFTYGSYRDRVDISPEEVYKQMEQEIPKTSIPGPQVLKEHVRPSCRRRIYTRCGYYGIYGLKWNQQHV